MTNIPDTQYQPRTNTLTDIDALEQLPRFFDIQNLAPDQVALLSDFNRHLSCAKLLQDIQADHQSVIKQMQAREADISAQIQEEYQEMNRIARLAIMRPVVNIGINALLSEERKKEQALLEEWRKKKYGTVK